MIDELIQGARALIGAIADAKLPPVIEETYAPGSAAAGTPRGRWTLRRDAEGAVSYAYSAADRAYSHQQAVAELEVGHVFDDLASLVAFARGREPDPEVFVHTRPFEPAAVKMVLNPVAPELGGCMLTINRHPAWVRWAAKTGRGTAVDLTHVELADLLLDNAEDLEQPAIAKVIAAFRSARTVAYDADLDAGGSMGVKVTWSSGSTAKSGDVAVPREFAARFPAYFGVHAPGDEPVHVVHRALFRLRVMPPKNPEQSSAPLFRVLWVNALDYELAAATAMHERIDSAFEHAEVYRGTPGVTHRILATN